MQVNNLGSRQLVCRQFLEAEEEELEVLDEHLAIPSLESSASDGALVLVVATLLKSRT